MPEPGSTALATTMVASVTLAALLTGLDADALIGATAGASLFVMSAKDLKIPVRIVYLVVALVMGYKGGPAVIGHVFPEPVVSAFVFSACVIGLTLRLMDGVNQIEVGKWLKPK